MSDDPKEILRAKASFQAQVDQACRDFAQKKFQEDLARKEVASKPSRPWSDETWMAAQRAFAEGRREPEVRFSIVITKSGAFTTPEKIKEVAGMGHVPEVQYTTQTRFNEGHGDYNLVDKATKKEENSKIPRDGAAVRYCMVSSKHRRLIEELTNGDDILVWIDDEKKFAWVADSMISDVGKRDGEDFQGVGALEGDEGGIVRGYWALEGDEGRIVPGC